MLLAVIVEVGMVLVVTGGAVMIVLRLLQFLNKGVIIC